MSLTNTPLSARMAYVAADGFEAQDFLLLFHLHEGISSNYKDRFTFHAGQFL